MRFNLFDKRDSIFYISDINNNNNNNKLVTRLSPLTLELFLSIFPGTKSMLLGREQENYT